MTYTAENPHADGSAAAAARPRYRLLLQVRALTLTTLRFPVTGHVLQGDSKHAQNAMPRSVEIRDESG